MKKIFYSLDCLPQWDLRGLLIVLSILSTSLTFAHDIEVDGIYYNINGDEATVTYKGTSYSPFNDNYSGNVIVPSSISYNGVVYAVTSIGDNAFYGSYNLRSITIPNSVTTIGDHAFDGCQFMTSLDIPNSVTIIGDYAFSQCYLLARVNIGSSVSTIGESVFSSCSHLASIVVAEDNPTFDSRDNCNAIIETESNTLIVGCINTIIPNSVTTIGEFAFIESDGLTSIEFPNSVTSIGSGAFWGCNALTSIDIGNSVSTIGENAFLGCSNLSSIKIAEDNPTFDSRDNCNAIIKTASNTLIMGCMNTIIPNSVTAIGNYAFSGCSGLTSIIIGSSVTSIGSGAFGICYGLTSIVIGSSVNTIGNNVFSGCNSLSSIEIVKENPTFDSRGSCNAIIETASNTLIAGCMNTIIPNSVTAIGNYAFSSNNGLTCIEIPNSVTTIGDGAFQYCGRLITIIVPNSVTTIGSWAFNSCYELTNIYMGSSVTKIHSYAFYGSNMVKNIFCFSETPPSCLHTGTFSNYSATLHVPAATLAAYFTAPDWSNFENIIGDAIAPTGIAINKDSVEMLPGQELQLMATIMPTNSSCKEVLWYSTDTNVATVDNGTVTATGYGECDIIASCLGIRAICHISVTNRIALDLQEAMLLPNHMLTLTPSAPDLSDEFTVTSSDPTVAAARVMNGKVQVVGIKEGTTTITIGSTDGTAIPATCLVTVYTEPGDLNSDGFINISDVTALISFILTNEESLVTIKNADINHDGKINVSDVTMLISTILDN